MIDSKIDDVIEIAVWPDYEWCYIEEIEDFLRMKSDDYRRVFLPDGDSEPSEAFIVSVANGELSEMKRSV